MTMTLTVLEATNLKHRAELKIVAAIKEFEEATELEVKAVDITAMRPIGQRRTQVTMVDLDVRFR